MGAYQYLGYNLCIHKGCYIGPLKCGIWALTQEWALAQDTMVFVTELAIITDLARFLHRRQWAYRTLAHKGCGQCGRGTTDLAQC